MALLICPSVGATSPRSEIEAWLEELRRDREQYAGDPDALSQIAAAEREARTWIALDLDEELKRVQAGLPAPELEMADLDDDPEQVRSFDPGEEEGILVLFNGVCARGQPMVLLICPPVGFAAPRSEIEAWLEKLARMREEHAGEPDALAQIGACEQEARHWLELDLDEKRKRAQAARAGS